MNEKTGQRAVYHLKNLMRINTTNPPGNESKAVEYIVKMLRRKGVKPVVIEPEAGRANCVLRLTGNGQKAAILVNAHLDVVPAGKETMWRFPPFEAHTDGGYIWGRGACDMKHMAAIMLAVAESLSVSNKKQRADVVFVWTADEESGGDKGAKFLVENHKELISANYGIGEVGGFPIKVAGQRFVVIQTAEKGIVWFKVKVKGKGGHGSVPDERSPIVRVGELLVKAGRKRLPIHVTKTASAFFREVIGEVISPAIAATFTSEIGLQTIGEIIKALPQGGLLRTIIPMLTNTVSPTMLKAGTVPNVIPEEVEVVVDGRILPGQNKEELINEFRKMAGNGFEYEVIKYAPPIEVDFENEFFDLMRRVVKDFQPDVKVVPFLNPGFTDGKWFSQIGIKWYGFTPLVVTPDSDFNYVEMVHCINERVEEKAVEEGATLLEKFLGSYL